MIGRHDGTEPITDDDDTIAAYLEDLSVPTLMASMVHLTGDPAWIRGRVKPLGIFLNEVQGFLPVEDQALVRAQALKAIRAYRDAGSQPTAPPPPEVVAEIMDFLVAEHVPEEYLGLVLEELELDGVDRRREPEHVGIGERAADDFGVVVIGAGMSGLLAGIRLAEAGVAFTILEKNAGVGGTWYENRYPGCRVDVGNHFYSYSFAPDDGWTEFFSRQPELQAYFEQCLHRFGVSDHVRFSTEVTAARWDDDAKRWTVSITRADGASTEITATAIISAVGQLNRPHVPDLPGRDSFAGVAMHSAAWIEGTEVAGKRVGVIGTGASAFQIVPTIAPEVEHLTVFQRSAQWMFPNPHYHQAVGPGVSWAVRHLPCYGRWYRFLLFWPACDGGLEAMRIDPDYPHPDVAVNELNEGARDVFTQWMTDQIADDPELIAKVVPDYVCLGRRTLQDNGSWLSALTRDDVDLVTEPIERITPAGVVTADGTEHPLDVLVYATGFHANRYLWPMEIVGRDRAVLSERWGDAPTAHLGITVPDFPNFFCLYGPATNLAHGGSIIFMIECQVRYVMSALAELADAGPRAALTVTHEAHDAYNERLQAELDTMVWSHPSIRHSWYRSPNGRIYILSPWRLVDYWSWTRRPNLSEFEPLERRGPLDAREPLDPLVADQASCDGSTPAPPASLLA
jgi:4-hydroxyacetophenone monooxygenase